MRSPNSAPTLSGRQPSRRQDAANGQPLYFVYRCLTVFGLASLMGVMATPSVRAEVTTFGLQVRRDGSAPFTGPDPTYPGSSNAGNDADASNGIVRTYDTVIYRVRFATDTQPNTNTEITVAIQDDYHLWDETQSACLGNLTISSDRKTLTCG